MKLDRVRLFYDAMGYPLINQETLCYLKWAEYDDEPLINESFQFQPQQCALFSWDEPKNELMQEYIEYIESLAWLRKSLPFISHIYLANSITFNALHQDSDIDLLCIVKNKRLWIARFCSRFLLFILGISRFGKRIKKKFCLSFYIEEKYTNLYTLLLQPLDIYMVFWLAHLVPVYCEQRSQVDHIRRTNNWLKGYFPNHPLKQVIRLGNTLVLGTTKAKTITESVFSARMGDLANYLIALVRKPILAIKKRGLGKAAWGVIISDGMLKFHRDKRKEYILKYLNKLKSRLP